MRKPDQPLSRPAFVATRVLGVFMLMASVTCIVVAWVFWHRLAWPWKVLLDGVPVLFLMSGRDIRKLFISYGRYTREWEEHGKPRPRT